VEEHRGLPDGGRGALKTRGEDRFCTTGAFSAGGRGNLERNPPEWEERYEPSGVRLYVPAGAENPTQFSGELRQTRGGCTWRYAMRGLSPSVPCEASLDASDPANAARTCGAGSGLPAGVAAVCEPQAGRCVPAGPIPSLR
jgi:hypothetical protein